MPCCAGKRSKRPGSKCPPLAVQQFNTTTRTLNNGVRVRDSTVELSPTGPDRFLLNQCPPAREASSVQNSITALEAVGALLRPHIAARADFLEAAHTGKGVTEVDPKGEAAQEMRDLWLAVDRLLRPFRRDKPKKV